MSDKPMFVVRSLAVLFFCAAVSGAQEIPVLENPRTARQPVLIGSLHFLGDDEIAQESRLALEQLELEDTPDLPALRELGLRVRYLYQTHGYYYAKIHTTARMLDTTPPRISADIEIKSNLQYRLKHIEFVHNKSASGTELRRRFPIEDGDIFNVEQIRTGLENLRKLYGERGYVNFTPVPDTVVHHESQNIELTIDIDEGPQFHIGTIGFSGFGAQDARFQEKALKWLKTKPGDVYNCRLIEEFFTENASWLPRGSKAEDNVEIALDTGKATVDLYFVFR